MTLFRLPTELRFDLYDELTQSSNPDHAFHVHPDYYGIKYHRGCSNDSLFCQNCLPYDGGYTGHCTPEIIFDYRPPLVNLALSCKFLFGELCPRFGKNLIIDFRLNRAHGRTVPTVMRYFVDRFSLECRAQVKTVHFRYLCTYSDIDLKSLSLLARRIDSDLPSVAELTLILSFEHLLPDYCFDDQARRHLHDDQDRQLWRHCEGALLAFIVQIGRYWRFSLGFDGKRQLCLRATLLGPVEAIEHVTHADIDGWVSSSWVKSYVQELNEFVRPLLAAPDVSERMLAETCQMRTMMAGM